MKKLIYLGSIITVLLIASCKDDSKNKETIITNKTASEQQEVSQKANIKGSDFSLEKKWELSGFKMPESVFASPDHKWLYVSNVNGADAGFISRVSKEGVIDKLDWVTGLGSPTGSDLYQGKLYIADLKKLHIIDVNKGVITESLVAKDAVSLNDVSINKATGQVFISDIAGGKIYTLQNGKLVKWLEDSEIIFPNGIYVKGNSLIVANYGLDKKKGLMRKQWKSENFGSLYSVDIPTKKVTLIPSSLKKGVFDGVTEINGVVLASSNPTGQLFTFENDKSYLIDASLPGIADINTDGETIYAPYLFESTLVAFQKVAWDRITTKEEYLEKGADNYYGDAEGTSIATSNGIIKGKFSGMVLKGTWDWQGQYFCRTSTIGTIDLGSDCIQIDVTNKKMRLILNKGTGMSVVYDKKESPQVIILSTFKIKPEYIDLYKKEMLNNQDVVRKEDCTLEMKLYQDKNKPENFLVFGINESQEKLASHSKAVEERGIADRVKNALVEAPETLFLTNNETLLTKKTGELRADIDDVILFFFFNVKDGHKDKLIAQLNKHTKLTRQEEGNIRFDFYAIKGKENSFVIQEHWKNEEAGAIHRDQSYTKETEALMKNSIDESSQQVFFVNQIEK